MITATRQVIRANARRLGKLFRRSNIEAAGTGRRWHSVPMLHAPQASTLAAQGTVMQRARAAAVNNPTAARVVETLVSALAGRPVQAMPQNPDDSLRRQLADDFEALINPHLVPLVRGVVRDGEAFLRLIADEEGRLRLQLLPPEQIDPTMTQDLGHGRRIIAGVELDASDRPVAYHVLPEAPGSAFAGYAPPVRVPAADILHIFDPVLPGQVRGLSWLTPILFKLIEMDRTSDAMLAALKTQSLVSAFVTDPTGEAGGFAGDGQGSTVQASLEPGSMHVLPPGATVSFSHPGAGLRQASEFVKAQLREIAAGAGLTYEQVSADLSDTNYSSARVGLLEFRRRAQMLHRTIIVDQLLRPLWQRWIDAELLAGRLDAGTDLYRVTFAPPGFDWVDPAKEVAAEVAAIEARLKSRAEVVAARGRDVTDLDEEIAADAARQPEGDT